MCACVCAFGLAYERACERACERARPPAKERQQVWRKVDKPLRDATRRLQLRHVGRLRRESGAKQKWRDGSEA
eukprot:1779945-Pleurochrysis_carterae.AAC.2